MAFGGLEFVFDDIHCSQYHLQICSMGNGSGSSSGGTDVTLHTDKTSSSYKFNLLGVSEDKPLTFDLSFSPLKVMTRQEVGLIQKWLFGHKEYKTLRIVQDDMSEVYYNCLLGDSEIHFSGNHPVLISCKVTCDSPFAWENPRTYTYTTARFTHLNKSDINDYVYPIVEFTTSGGIAMIVNESNEGREALFEGLLAGERIVIDGEYQTVSSSKNLNRLKNFNKKWVELVSGENVIATTGITSLKITYANARRIGG